MTKRVRFVDQWTLTTRSDHKALFVQVEIRNRRKGPWVPLLLVTCNMGGRFGYSDLRAVALEAGSERVVICLQEGGDQGYVGDFANAYHFQYVGGNNPGESSTAMLIDPSIRIRQSSWRQVVGRVKVGKGAGPDRSKAKGWHKTRLSVGDVRFGASSWHQYASQQNRLRYLWALRLAGPIVASILRMGRPFFLCGDTNADNSQPLIRWLIRRGMTTNHRELEEVATHGNRSIDAVAVQKAMVKR